MGEQFGSSPRRVINVALALLVVVLAFAHARISFAQFGSLRLHWHGTRDIRWTWGPGHNGQEETLAQNAINDWHNMTVLNFSRSGSGNLLLETGNWGATGWAGLATVNFRPGPNGEDHNDITQCTAQLNKHYDKSAAGALFLFNGPYWRGVYCQEIGHCLGVDHLPQSCMGLGYLLQQPNGGYAYTNAWTPSRRDADLVNASH